jgi:hypothetical protein
MHVFHQKIIEIIHILWDIKRSFNQLGVMKKVIVVSLLLIGIFLIGSSGKAWATFICVNPEEYQCNFTQYVYGEVNFQGPFCANLCLNYPSSPDSLYVESLACDLYPSTGSKYLLGTCNTYSIGCSVELNGRSLTARFTGIEDNEGYVGILKCKPCNDCCAH